MIRQKVNREAAAMDGVRKIVFKHFLVDKKMSIIWDLYSFASQPSSVTQQEFNVLFICSHILHCRPDRLL